MSAVSAIAPVQSVGRREPRNCRARRSSEIISCLYNRPKCRFEPSKFRPASRKRPRIRRFASSKMFSLRRLYAPYAAVQVLGLSQTRRQRAPGFDDFPSGACPAPVCMPRSILPRPPFDRAPPDRNFAKAAGRFVRLVFRRVAADCRKTRESVKSIAS